MFEAELYTMKELIIDELNDSNYTDIDIKVMNDIKHNSLSIIISTLYAPNNRRYMMKRNLNIYDLIETFGYFILKEHIYNMVKELKNIDKN